INSLVPKLQVRLPPDYLQSKQLFWTVHELDPPSTKRVRRKSAGVSSDDDDDLDLQAEFEQIELDKQQRLRFLVRKEIGRKLDLVSRFYINKMTIPLLARAWVSFSSTRYPDSGASVIKNVQQK
ncbi:hypothetical protein Ciccas_007729, partial [Cichlidogyrus casuarinus]